MTDSVVCQACGTRMKAGRQRCLRCGEPLQAAPPRAPFKLSSGQTLIVGGVLSLAVLATVLIVLATSPPMVEGDPSSVSSALPPSAEPAAAAAVQTPGMSETSAPDFVDPARAGRAAFTTGNFEAARLSYEEALAAHPGDPEVLNNLGQILVRQGRVEEAVARLERAAALAPENWVYRFNLAHAVGRLGQWDRAAAEYREAGRLFPDDYATQYNLAMALHKKGDDQAAIPEFEKAIQLAPGEPSFHVSLAISLEKVGRTTDAIREYHAYLEMAPSAPDAGRVKTHIDALAAAQPAAGAGPASTS